MDDLYNYGGEYVRAAFRQKPPLELAREQGIPLPELLKQMAPDTHAEAW